MRCSHIRSTNDVTIASVDSSLVISPRLAAMALAAVVRGHGYEVRSLLRWMIHFHGFHLVI